MTVAIGTFSIGILVSGALTLLPGRVHYPGMALPAQASALKNRCVLSELIKHLSASERYALRSSVKSCNVHVLNHPVKLLRSV